MCAMQGNGSSSREEMSGGNWGLRWGLPVDMMRLWLMIELGLKITIKDQCSFPLTGGDWYREDGEGEGKVCRKGRWEGDVVGSVFYSLGIRIILLLNMLMEVRLLLVHFATDGTPLSLRVV